MFCFGRPLLELFQCSAEGWKTVYNIRKSLVRIKTKLIPGKTKKSMYVTSLYYSFWFEQKYKQSYFIKTTDISDANLKRICRYFTYFYFHVYLFVTSVLLALVKSPSIVLFITFTYLLSQVFYRADIAHQRIEINIPQRQATETSNWSVFPHMLQAVVVLISRQCCV